MVKFFQLGILRVPRLKFCLCLAAWLLISALLVLQTGRSKQAFVDLPTKQWAVDMHAGCPPRLDVLSLDPDRDAKLARPLSAAKLLCRPLPSDCSSVPKLLHQSWKTHELPAKFEKWSTVCREKHHDWEWVLWSNEDNLNLVRKFFPWLEEMYLALPGDIYRADLARNLYMYIFGGVYADLDTDCLRPTLTVFQAFGIPNTENTTAGADGKHLNQSAVFGRMGTDQNFENSIPNAWMASPSGHPFFLMHLMSLSKWTGPIALRNDILDFNANGLRDEAAALAAVGPFASQAKKTEQKIVLLPDHWIYPYNWDAKELRPLCSVEENTFDAKACQERLEVGKKGSISITYWSHTHNGKKDNAENIDKIS